MMILRDHDEAVWTLFNNESAQDGSQNLLFSGSASGQMLAFDIDRGNNHDTTIIIIIIILITNIHKNTLDQSYD